MNNQQTNKIPVNSKFIIQIVGELYLEKKILEESLTSLNKELEKIKNEIKGK